MSVLIIVLVLLVVSCEEETPSNGPDKENLIVKLDLSQTNEELSGVVTLSVAVDSDQGTDRVVFYLNDELIGEATEKPFEISWDSREKEDGSYTLKAVATDRIGNKQEDAKEVRIRNTLMSIYMEEGYRSSKLDYDLSEDWFFLSDKKGNMIGEPKKLSPTEVISWKRPAGFTDDKIVINKFTYINRESTIIRPKILYTLYSYADQPASDLILAAGSPASALKELGSAEINIDNRLPVGPDLTFSARTEYSETRPDWAMGGEPITLMPIMYEKEQQKCLVTYTPTYAPEGEDRIPNFYWMDIQLNERYQISTDLFLPMKATEISVPDEKGRANINLVGYLGNEDERRGFFLSNVELEAQSLSGNLYLPEGAFSYYTVDGRVSGPNKYIYEFRINSIPDVISKPDFTAVISSSDVKNVKLTTNKKHDMLYVNWGYGQTTDGIWEYLDRRLYLGKETDEKYVLPDVPDVIAEKYPILNNSLFYAGTVLYDYPGISSYQEFFEGMYGSNSGDVDLTTYYKALVLLDNRSDNSGARLQTLGNELPEGILLKELWNFGNH